MSALYNEIEPYAVKWLSNLIDGGHIAKGVVDGRDIRDLRPADLAGHEQAHFFAGIGVWSYALRLAGVPNDFPVWTGSCPCQPFSVAGRGGGFADERHLWPDWFRLIRECRPPVVFGEQVASADGLAWLDLVSADMERAGYAFAAADLCAAGVGAPHIRQRLFFVAYANEYASQRNDADRCGEACRLGNPSSAGLEGRNLLRGIRPAEMDAPKRQATERAGNAALRPWSGADWLQCRDGKARPVEPGSFPLAHGAPARVGRLRAYGNAIVAPLAAEFIAAAMEAIGVVTTNQAVEPQGEGK